MPNEDGNSIQVSIQDNFEELRKLCFSDYPDCHNLNAFGVLVMVQVCNFAINYAFSLFLKGDIKHD